MTAAATHGVLLTGANGLLGQKLVHRLAGQPSRPLVATGQGPSRLPNHQGFRYESLNLTDFKRMRQLFETYNPKLVLHAGALTNVDYCEQHPDECQAVNTKATQHLAGLCREHGARLLLVSTDFVFDGRHGPYDETAEPNPLSIYGRSKLEAERWVQQAGIEWAIARTILVYGVVHQATRSNIVLWVKNNLEKGQHIKVVTDQYRMPTLAEDLADGLVAMLDRNARGIFHLCGPQMYGIHELAHQVARFWNLDAGLIGETTSAQLGQPALRPPRTGFVLDKARMQLGYAPQDLLTGLSMLDAQLKQQTHPA